MCKAWFPLDFFLRQSAKNFQPFLLAYAHVGKSRIFQSAHVITKKLSAL